MGPERRTERCTLRIRPRHCLHSEWRDVPGRLFTILKSISILREMFQLFYPCDIFECMHLSGAMHFFKVRFVRIVKKKRNLRLSICRANEVIHFIVPLCYFFVFNCIGTCLKKISYFNFKIEQLKQPCFSMLTFKVKSVPKNLYVFNILLSCKYFRVLVSISSAFLQLISTHMLKKFPSFNFNPFTAEGFSIDE